MKQRAAHYVKKQVDIVNKIDNIYILDNINLYINNKQGAGR